MEVKRFCQSFCQSAFLPLKTKAGEGGRTLNTRIINVKNAIFFEFLPEFLPEWFFGIHHFLAIFLLTLRPIIGSREAMIKRLRFIGYAIAVASVSLYGIENKRFYDRQYQQSVDDTRQFQARIIARANAEAAAVATTAK